MSIPPTLTTAAAHRYFAAHCFNQAWKLIDQPTRTPEEMQQLIELCLASIWHWTQREDCTDKNLSIGYWQAARVFTLAGSASEAKRYGELSLKYSENVGPFYTGYAYEALARAEKLAGDAIASRAFLDRAFELAMKVKGIDDRQLLLDDLATISSEE